MRGQIQPVDANRSSLLSTLGRSMIGARLVLQVAVLVAAVAALRAWAPLEVQIQIDALTERPIARTSAAFSAALERATDLARAVEQKIGWRSGPRGPVPESPDAF